MNETRTYKKTDALSCEISETSTAKKIFNVDGVWARKERLEKELALVNEVIAEMKKEGCDFSDKEVVPVETPEA